jgi:hypothetical protein
LRGANIKVSNDRPMWGGLDFRLGVTCGCRGRFPGASLARQLTLRNLMRLPGQRGSLVANNGPEQLPRGASNHGTRPGDRRWRHASKCLRIGAYSIAASVEDQLHAVPLLHATRTVDLD